MFQGRFSSTLRVDAKNRISLPAVFRVREREEDLDTFMLGSLSDPCLYLHAMDQHDEFLDRIYRQLGDTRESRAFKTVILSRFVPVGVDAAGRITLPAQMLEVASIQKEVVLISQKSRVEIWGLEVWKDKAGRPDLPPAVVDALERVFSEEERELRANTRGAIPGREGENPFR